MAIRIGINPIGWSNDDLPELGGDIPLEQCLSEARAAGYAGVELGNKFPRDAAVLQPILKTYDLALVSGWYSTFLLTRDADAEFAATAAHRRLLRAMGCSVLIVAECTGTVHGERSKALAARPIVHEHQWPVFCQRLTRLAELLSNEGLILAYHHHMGTVVQTGAEIDRVMGETGSAVRLLLDTGHATWAGADPVALARRWHKRIAHVHAKDVRPEIGARALRENWSFLNAVIAGIYTVPGDGCIDFAAVLAALPDYDGWIVVEAEQDPKKAPPAEYARKGFLHLAGLRAAHISHI